MPGPEIYSLTLYPSECGLFNFEDCGDGWTAIQLGSRHWYYHLYDNASRGVPSIYMTIGQVDSAVRLFGYDDNYGEIHSSMGSRN